MPASRQRPLDPELQRRLARLRHWSTLLDSAFRVPGTNLRFGWDPIVGLVPWLGDLVSPVFSIAVLIMAIQLGIPRIVQVRMALTILVDVAVGIVPVVGDLFDFVWKSNEWNLRLLERHAHAPRAPGAGDWIFVIVLLVVIGSVAALPLLALIWLLRWLGFSLL
jgi:hypothetical protein